MPSTSSILKQLTIDYPSIHFEISDTFMWSPEKKTIFYEKSSKNASLLLHELGHALSDHRAYDRDVQLVAMESEAWQKAQDISKSYGVVIDEDAIQDHLDTYRDWLHARSQCPRCEATGQQTAKNTYHCIACDQRWTVNEARTCGLKRYTDHKKIPA